MADFFAGPLVVRGSNIRNLSYFMHLHSVMAGAEPFEHEGGRYAVAIYGMALGMKSAKSESTQTMTDWSIWATYSTCSLMRLEAHMWLTTIDCALMRRLHGRSATTRLWSTRRQLYDGFAELCFGI